MYLRTINVLFICKLLPMFYGYKSSIFTARCNQILKDDYQVLSYNSYVVNDDCQLRNYRVLSITSTGILYLIVIKDIELLMVSMKSIRFPLYQKDSRKG